MSAALSGILARWEQHLEDVELVARALGRAGQLYLGRTEPPTDGWIAIAPVDVVLPGHTIIGVGPTPSAAVADLGRELRRVMER